MSSEDKLEEILRGIHLMVAEAMPLNGVDNQIIIDKRVILEHLNRLNVAIYEIMDEYELTQQSRDRAERDARKQGEEIIHKAELRAEDVYAASMLYTNDALTRMQYIMQDVVDHFEKTASEAKELLAEERRTVRSNQSELKGQLQDLKDTEKYLRIIEESNKKIEREREEEQQRGRKKERSPYADVKPEIKINPEYFEKIGAPLDEDGNPVIPEEEEVPPESAISRFHKLPIRSHFEDDLEILEFPEEEKPAEKAEVKVNLDSEYFRRKNRERSNKDEDI